MDINWRIAGHKKQLEFLENATKRGKLAHAYIFAGPSSVGKRTIAMRLAQTLLCEKQSLCSDCPQCKTFIAAANADFLDVADETGIKIDQVRDLIYKLSLKPYMAKYKIAVIDNAESMTTEAANALLKSLEEPKPHTIIILITSAPDRLLKTISSRAQKITFGPVGHEEYKALLPGKLSSEQKNLMAFADGKPGLALKIAQDEEFLANLSDLDEKYKVFRSSDEAVRLTLVSDLAELETHQLKNALGFWSNRLRQEFITNPTNNLAKELHSLNLAQSYLDSNANSKLLLTNLMLTNING